MINNYLAILGMVTFISGRYLVRLLLKILGPRYILHPLQPLQYPLLILHHRFMTHDMQ
jgi:hypothetical protein